MAERVDSLFYPQSLRLIARALEAVDRCGELPRLTQRFVLEHPLHRAHRRDYDEQFITCLTEGCALAWADLRHLGPLRFTSQIEGAPDIQAESGLWIEAKSIGPSKEDRQLVESMRASKGPHVGTPRLPAEGLWRKFDYVLSDTQKKLDRQTQREGVLFLHLTTLDIQSWPLKDEFFALLPAWMERKKVEAPNIRIVVTYSYDWQTPVIDPISSE
jgi:hypothetical protein